jgi:phosphonate transport system substrate-binding protein
MFDRLQDHLRWQLLRLAALACLLPAVALADPDTLYFAPLPMEQPEEVVKQFKPMLNFLEQRLGVKIEIRYSSSYAEILERFRTGQIDLAYLGPLPYVSLRENHPQAEPLVHFLEKDGQATYSCALFGSDQRLEKPLRNKTFALTQPLSTCGYLAVDGLLRQRGERLDQQRFRYLEKHDEAVLAVARGDYDFGGAKTSIAKNYAHLGIVVLAETPPLPSFALVANSRRLSAERMSQLRRTLAELEPKGRNRSLMSTWGPQLRNGAVGADDSDYDVLRRLRRQASIPEKDNF